MGIAIMGFVFPHSMQSMLEENFTDKIIHTYRDDPDLQNLIDFAQQEVSATYYVYLIYSYLFMTFSSSDAAG